MYMRGFYYKDQHLFAVHNLFTIIKLRIAVGFQYIKVLKIYKAR